jgi:urease alpha subunit
MSEEEKPDGIGKKLNLTPMSTPLDQNTKAISTIIADAHNDSVQEDFDFARSNIRQLIDDGNDAIFKLGQIAEQSQNARAYEVLGGIFSVMLKANQDLMDLQKKALDLKNKTNYNDSSSGNAGPKTINNSIFVGSTNELSKLINNMKRGE